LQPRGHFTIGRYLFLILSSIIDVCDSVCMSRAC
jgi:hypothetical protein